jgi:hypothetical protein
MRDPRDYKLDLTAAATAGSAEGPDNGVTPAQRPYLSVRFACCNVYVRIYRSADGLSYRGRCPRCGKPVSFAVGAGGTDARSFIVE